MTGQTYRNLQGTPNFLCDDKIETVLWNMYGDRGIEQIHVAMFHYFHGKESREEIAAGLEESAVRFAFLLCCDQIDARDSSWKGNGRSRSAAGIQESACPPETSQTESVVTVDWNGAFRPPVTEAERCDFIRAVQGFALDAGLAGFDAEAFVRAMEIKGWKTVRGAVIVCWKQAARKWHAHQGKGEAAAATAAPEPPAEPKPDVPEAAPEPPMAQMHVSSASSPALAPLQNASSVLPPAEKTSSLQNVQPRQSSMTTARLPQNQLRAAVSTPPHAILNAAGMVTDSDLPCMERCIRTAGGRMHLADYQALLSFTGRISEALICRAADLAAENAVYNPARYMIQVLQNWVQSGICSMDDLLSQRQSAAPEPDYPQRACPDESEAIRRARESVAELQARFGRGENCPAG